MFQLVHTCGSFSICGMCHFPSVLCVIMPFTSAKSKQWCWIHHLQSVCVFSLFCCMFQLDKQLQHPVCKEFNILHCQCKWAASFPDNNQSCNFALEVTILCYADEVHLVVMLWLCRGLFHIYCAGAYSIYAVHVSQKLGRKIDSAWSAEVEVQFLLRSGQWLTESLPKTCTSKVVLIDLSWEIMPLNCDKAHSKVTVGATLYL